MVRPFLAASALLAALPAALAGCARTYNDVQACAQPEVLYLVADRLQKTGLSPHMETAAIGQAPGPAPGIVLCAVWIHRLAYDTPRYGLLPRDTLVTYQYQLQIRQNAAFLLPDPTIGGSDNNGPIAGIPRGRTGIPGTGA